jgi:3-oxoacyl-[acyl-carrier protein] reductase
MRLRLAAFIGLLLPTLMHASRSALQGKRVLVTGGGRGIGRAIAVICASEGASHVALLARSEDELKDSAGAVEEHGARALVRSVDVTSDELDSVIEALASEMGGIDILVNNAGNSCTKAPVHKQSAAEFRALLELNVVAVASVSSSVLRHAMLAQSSGHIINISSRAGKLGIANSGPYVASKFAVEGLTATLAEELKGTEIVVNSISPGMVDTRAFPKAPGRPGVRTAESIRDGLLAVLSSGRSGTYLHVDEYDAAVAAGEPEKALKPINEPTFEPSCTDS